MASNRLVRAKHRPEGEPFFVGLGQELHRWEGGRVVGSVFRFVLLPGRVVATGPNLEVAEQRALDAMDLHYERLEREGTDPVAWWRDAWSKMNKLEKKEWREAFDTLPSPMEGRGRHRFLPVVRPTARLASCT